MNELEAAEVDKIRDAIEKIEKFKFDIRNIKTLRDEVEFLREDNDNKNLEISRLRINLNSVENRLSGKYKDYLENK